MIPPIIRLLRPHQWTKNFFVFAPLLFAFEYENLDSWRYALLAFFAFTFMAGACYVLNDLKDAEHDKLHPTKKRRPIAAGEVSKSTAITLLVISLLISIICVLPLSEESRVILALYGLLNVAYSLLLKRFALIDVMSIAAGFVLRVLMGGFAIGVEVSSWIILTTFLLAMLLGFGKRYHEMGVEGYSDARESLQGYSKPLLDRLLGISCATTLMSYALYCTETGRNTTPYLVFTVIFVAFGLFYYLQKVYTSDKPGVGEPEQLVLKDPIFIANAVLWLGSTLWLLQ